MNVGSMPDYSGEFSHVAGRAYGPEQIMGRHMLRQIRRPLHFLASWLGGWSRLVLLVLVLIGIGVGLLWERQRHAPVPEGAVQVSTSIIVDLRQMTFRYPGSVTQVRAFYQQVMPSHGWRYCGTQATPRCTNLIRLVDRPGEAIDVYRRANDRDYRGSTVEIWPIDTENGQTYVTLFETRSK